MPVTRPLLWGVLFHLTACTGGGVAVLEPTDATLAITHVNVIPMNQPGVLEDHTVLVRDDRIIAVTPADESDVPRGARIIDGAGRYLIPGLADMHEHLPRGQEEWEFGLAACFDLQLAAGVTTIRSMRGAAGDVALREVIERGEQDGPRLILGSPGIDAELAPDPATARARVREFRDAGFDFLKILEGFDRTTFDAIADEARAMDLPLAGHLSDTVDLELALSTPLHSIEHTHGHGQEARERPAAFAELAQRTREAGVWICPTLGFQVSWYAQEDLDSLASWPGVEYAHPSSVSFWTEASRKRADVDSETLIDYTHRMQGLRRAVRGLAAEGVGLLVSSSGGYFLIPGFSMFVEFRCLADAGLTPREILEAATIAAARSENQEDDWGSIAPGLSADLVLLAANPLEDIRNTEAVVAVVRRGECHDRQDLDRRLAAVRARW